MATIPIGESNIVEWEEPTARLRWRNGMLEQLWKIEKIDTSVHPMLRRGGLTEEWRPVETVDEPQVQAEGNGNG